MELNWKKIIISLGFWSIVICIWHVNTVKNSLCAAINNSQFLDNMQVHSKVHLIYKVTIELHSKLRAKFCPKWIETLLYKGKKCYLSGNLQFATKIKRSIVTICSYNETIFKIKMIWSQILSCYEYMARTNFSLHTRFRFVIWLGDNHGTSPLCPPSAPPPPPSIIQCPPPTLGTPPLSR